MHSTHWKWTTILFELALSSEVVVFLIFWTIMFPILEVHKQQIYFGLVADHLVPFVLLMIEFIMNRIRFSIRHLVIAAKILVIYGVVNMIYTLSKGEPIYSGIDWKSFDSFVAIIVIFLASLSLFVLIFYV